jgi:hypothetical protein
MILTGTIVNVAAIRLLQKYSVHGSTGSPRTEYQPVTRVKSVRPELVEG